MEVVIACVFKLAEYLVEPTIKQARYLFCFNNIVKDLEGEEINLNRKKIGIKEKVKQEEDNTREIDEDVEDWLKDVDKAMDDVQTLKSKIQVKKSCFNGWCPNWGCRYWLGRKATKMTSRMSELKDKKFSTVAHLKHLPGIEFSTPRDFMPFKATEMASEQIIKALKNEKTKMVGLYGAGGAGKTTLAKVVGNKLKQQKIFDEVVVVVVSQHPTFINVQKILAKSLRLELNEETKEERARRLYLRFTETKSKILVILDDVWSGHDLKNELGIPVDGDHNGCKILLTTRRKQVCDFMRCNLSIQLEILMQEEGLSLLKRYADIGDGDYTLKDVLEDIAGECKGLPLAIAAVGSALRGKDVDEWKAAFRKLQKGKLIDVDDIDRDTYACLKLSYDYLNDEDSKSCFLLCSLFPEDYEIDLEELVRYGVGLGWYEDDESIEDDRSLLRATIKGLKNSSMLLETDKEGFVKMHDIVRDVALWIGSNEKKFFSKADKGLTEWPKVEGMEQYIGISMMGHSIEMLPNGLVCPDLHILLLGNEGHKIKVPDQFFGRMEALKVVTIIGGVLSLKSLRFLTNLRVLHLIDCYVSDLAFLEKLNTLQILLLKMRYYRDQEIPKDLGDKLNKLKLFETDVTVDTTAIARFSRLQEFYGSIADLEVAGTSSENSFPKLHRYNIENGGGFAEKENQTKALKIQDIEATSLGIFSALYQNLQLLHLWNISGCENIVPSINQSGLKELTSLKLNSCGDLECVLDASQHEKSWNLVMLSRLAELELIELPKLQWIWKAPAQHVSLQNLTEVIVRKCNKLTHIFTLSQARSLVNLISLHVEDCERLQYIVEAKFDDNEINVIGGDGKNIAMPMLRELLLFNLPNLVSFCSENYYSTWQALQKLNLFNCCRLNVSDEFQYIENLQILKMKNCLHLYDAIPSLMKLEVLRISGVGIQEVIIGGDGQESKLFPSLKSLDLDRLPELEVLYKGPTHSFSLQNLTILWVYQCHRLRHLLSPTLAQNLLQLEAVYIYDCLELEQIIDDSEDQHYLQSISFPNLKSLDVRECPKLKCLFHISVAPSLEKLKRLIIKNTDELVEVFWHKDEAKVIDVKEFVMTQLHYLELSGLPKLINFCPEGYRFTCLSLNSYDIEVLHSTGRSTVQSVDDEEDDDDDGNGDEEEDAEEEAQQTRLEAYRNIQFPREPYRGLQILSFGTLLQYPWEPHILLKYDF